MKCTIAIGPITGAMKGKKALQAGGIETQVVRLMPGETQNGCAWGIEIPCDMIDEAAARLRRDKIPYSQLLRTR